MKKYITSGAAVLLVILTACLLSGCFAASPPASEKPGTEQDVSPEIPETRQPEATQPDADETQNETEQADEKLEAERAAQREIILEQSSLLLRGYFYEEAIELLNKDEALINHETKLMEEEIMQAMNSRVLYDGTVRHIFFHSLILYPEYLFPDLSVPTGGYNEGFAFHSELVKILPELLDRGYVLYNINDVFAKDANGNMAQKDIYLPPGKMPLILSVDDPTYHYGIGFANKMIIDENGDLATEVITPSGEAIVTYDGDVELVVNNFVKEHPEFSYRGHKGIVASTGYMGIFGYDLETEESRQDARAVCDKLKSEGWLFASHSYTHNRSGYWGPDSSAANISSDTKRWRDKIEPVTGATNIFIAPFGYTLKGAAMDVILDNGFDIYCSVAQAYKAEVYPRYALMSRIEIGGYSLARYAELLTRDFFDAKAVKDQHRPPMLSS